MRPMMSLIALCCCNFALAQEPPGNTAPVSTVGLSGLAPVVTGLSNFANFALSADGKSLLVACGQGATQWDLTAGKVLHTYEGHKETVVCVALRGDGKIALTGSADGKAILWDADSGQRKFICTGHQDSIRGATFSKGGKLALVGSQDGSASLWRTDGSKLQTFKGDVGVINCVDLLPFGDENGFVLTGTRGRGAILWDMKTGRRLKRSFGEPKFNVSAAAFGRNTRHGFVAIAGEKKVLLFETDARKANAPFRTFDLKDYVGGMALSADGKLLVVGCNDGNAYLWEIERHNKEPRTFTHRYESKDTPAMKKKRKYPPRSDAAVGQVALTPDGKHLWTASVAPSLFGADRLTLWDVAAGKELVRLYNGHKGQWLVVAPDGRFDGPREAWQYLSYREAGANKFLSDAETRRRFHHPGLLAKVLITAPTGK
jgi:WD40 repeat protein